MALEIKSVIRSVQLEMVCAEEGWMATVAARLDSEQDPTLAAVITGIGSSATDIVAAAQNALFAFERAASAWLKGDGPVVISSISFPELPAGIDLLLVQALKNKLDEKWLVENQRAAGAG